MSIRQLPSARWTVPGNEGVVAAGYYVYTYQPGTSTPKATYTDYTGNTANTNPIVLNARGEENIWWDGQYKVAVYTGDKDNGGVLVWTQDDYGEGTTSVLQGNFNLVINGSFEQDTNGDGEPDDWTVVEYTGSGGVTRDSTEQIHGKYALKFLSTGSGGGYATSSFFEVQESRVVPVGFAIKSSVAGVHNQVDVIWYTSAQAVISTTTLYNDTATNPTSWTFKTYTPTPPSTARFARIRLFGCKDDDATVGTTWFDNVVAESVAITTQHFANVNGPVTATDEELNTLDGITASTAELNYADGPNTANKFCLLDSNADVPLAQIPDTLTGKTSEFATKASTMLTGSITIIQQDVSVPNGNEGTASAICPVGYKCTGGGVFGETSTNWVIRFAYPTTQSFTGRAQNNTGATALLSVYAVCIDVT